jgi:hypothetical protein
MPAGFKPLLDQDARWVDPDTGRPTPEEYEYTKKLDTIIRRLVFGPLTSAADDTAAATAGVPIGGLYQNSGAVRVRLT